MKNIKYYDEGSNSSKVKSIALPHETTIFKIARLD